MMPTLRTLSLAAMAGLLCLPAAAQTGKGVEATKHNLTASGPGTVKVAGTRNVCKFCHTPHASSPIAPLWNRPDPGSYYQTYESTTLVASVGQPSGSSRLCLSCHDGTIALTQTYNPRNAPAGTIFITSADRGYIGTNLSDDHPISFVYDSSLASRKGQLRDPLSLPAALKLDHRGELQCTTCHDPHKDLYGKFLTMRNDESAMCRTCHTINEWSLSAHASSTASLGAARGDRWDNLRASTVRQAACESCHRPHTAGGRHRLLRREAEEDNCLSCHDGTVAAKNIDADLRKFSLHPVRSTTGVHDPTEDPSLMPEHVECVDCHDPHRAAGSPAARAPFIQASMRGVSGLTGSGLNVAKATYQYQVCYKCHSIRPTVDPTIERVIAETNIAKKFAVTNRSFHPVEAPGRNMTVPSLTQAFKTTSILYCTDCHGSDNGASGTSGARGVSGVSGVSGARGPHGSNYKPLLLRNYDTRDFNTESPAAYALCYGCHTRENILADQSFSKHKAHLDKQAPCSACHDPHGLPAGQLAGSSGAHLINFDRRIVSPSKTNNQGPRYTDSGTRRGSCTLFCHGKEHNNQTYAP